ncbi:hypothetical protein U6U98_12195, partial [Cutibacterium acnes]
SSIIIGSLSVVYQHCNALKFRLEAPSLGFADGKVTLPVLTHNNNNNNSKSNHFLFHAQKYNGCFQMTSFGAEVVQQPGYNPSYKVKASLFYQHEQL